MYKIYTTDALVCRTLPRNTADLSVLLFTREAGMLVASVKSGREERSKHRSALQEFSLVRVSLVRGKSGWRVTGAEPLGNLYFRLSSRQERTVLRNTVRFLRRFVHGEEPVQALFDDIVDALASGEPEVLSDGRLETALTLRMLHTLGYVAVTDRNRPIVDAPTARRALAFMTDARAASGRRAIEHAGEASQL